MHAEQFPKNCYALDTGNCSGIATGTASQLNTWQQTQSCGNPEVSAESRGLRDIPSLRYLLHRPLYNRAVAGAGQDGVSAIKLKAQDPAGCLWHGKALHRSRWVLDGP